MNTNDVKTLFKWNLATDFIAATIAGFVATPFVSIIDKAVVQSTAKSISLKATFKEGTKQLLNPSKFIRSPQFLMVWSVYSATYLAANWSDTISEEYKFSDKYKLITKLSATTSVNMTACILKDKLFAVKYGIQKVQSFPLISYNLFLVRDIISIGSSFTLPKLISDEIYKKTSYNVESQTQLILPGLCQFINTPIHLLSLDYYNRSNMKFNNRIRLIFDLYKTTTIARIFRLSWSFGIGGLANTKIRNILN
jgi:hypothetical protein